MAKTTYWTAERLIAEAKRYRTKQELRLANQYVYTKIIAAKLGPIAFEHMPARSAQKSKWSDTALKTEASKFNSPTEFKTNSQYAYNLARERGLMAELFH